MYEAELAGRNFEADRDEVLLPYASRSSTVQSGSQ